MMFYCDSKYFKKPSNRPKSTPSKTQIDSTTPLLLPDMFLQSVGIYTDIYTDHLIQPSIHPSIHRLLAAPKSPLPYSKYSITGITAYGQNMHIPTTGKYIIATPPTLFHCAPHSALAAPPGALVSLTAEEILLLNCCCCCFWNALLKCVRVTEVRRRALGGMFSVGLEWSGVESWRSGDTIGLGDGGFDGGELVIWDGMGLEELLSFKHECMWLLYCKNAEIEHKRVMRL